MKDTETVKVRVGRRSADLSGVYGMCIRNVASYLRSKTDLEKERDHEHFDAFEAATVISVAFAKLKEDVLADIISVDVQPVKA